MKAHPITTIRIEVERNDASQLFSLAGHASIKYKEVPAMLEQEHARFHQKLQELVDRAVSMATTPSFPSAD